MSGRRLACTIPTGFCFLVCWVLPTSRPYGTGFSSQQMPSNLPRVLSRRSRAGRLLISAAPSGLIRCEDASRYPLTRVVFSRRRRAARVYKRRVPALYGGAVSCEVWGACGASPAGVSPLGGCKTVVGRVRRT
jgi:hypothetical protein